MGESVKVEICQVCMRTDAFTPGKVDHDKEWHEAYDYISQDPMGLNGEVRQYRKELNRMEINLQ